MKRIGDHIFIRVVISAINQDRNGYSYMVEPYEEDRVSMFSHMLVKPEAELVSED